MRAWQHTEMRSVLSVLPILAALLGLSAGAMAAPGDKKWELVISNSIVGLPAVAANGDLLVGSADGKLYSITPSGALRWCVTTPVTVFGLIVGPDGAIYFGADQLHALNPDGSQRWHFSGAERDPIGYTDTPVLGLDGAVYVTRVSFDREAQRIYAVNPDGTMRWMKRGVFSRPAAIGLDGSILVTGEFGGLAAINPDGTIRWAHGAGNIPGGSVAVATNGTILIGNGGNIFGDGAIHAVSPDGSELWHYSTGELPTSSPIIGPDGTIYSTFTGGRAIALTASGQPRWNYQIDGELPPDVVVTSPALAADGTLYFGAGSSLFALDPGGRLLWRKDIAQGQSPLSAPLIGPDGTVYVVVHGEELVAVEGTGSPLAAGQWPMVDKDARHSRALIAPAHVPAKPGNVTATLDRFTDRIDVQWDSVRGATHYVVLRATTTNAAGAEVIADGITGTVRFSDRTSRLGETFFYFVHARNGAGVGEMTGPVQGRRRVATVGEAIWIYPGEEPLAAPPTLGPDGTVYFASQYGQGGALDTTGRLKWQYKFGGRRVSAAAAGADGTVYFVAGTTNNPINQQDEQAAVFAFAPNGTPRWVAPLSGAFATGVAIGADGTLYLGMDNSPADFKPDPALVALNPDGSTRWVFRDRHDVSSTPVVGIDGTIYATSKDGWLRAVAPDGRVLWSHYTEDRYSSQPLIDRRGVLFLAGEFFHAWNPDGVRLWRESNDNADTYISAIDARGVVYAASVGRHAIIAFNPDGTSRWTAPYAGFNAAGMAVDRAGNLLVAGPGSDLQALDPDGHLLWAYAPADTFIDGPVLGTNAIVYLASASGSVYAVRASEPPQNSAWPQMFHDAQHTARATQLPPGPAAPAGLAASGRTRVTDVRLTWASVIGASSYEIFRGTNGVPSNSVSIGTITGQTYFDDQDVVPERTYSYWLRAKNAGGVSGLAGPVTGIRRQAVPGDLLFTWNLDGPISGSPAIGPDGTVYVSIGASTSDGQLFNARLAALRSNGTVVWIHETDAPGITSPTLAPDGTIYVGTRGSRSTFPFESRLLALDSDGSQRWEYRADDAIDATPALGLDGTIYIATTLGQIIALTPEGVPRWTRLVGTRVDSSLVVAGDEAIYAFARDGVLTAIHPDGTLRWRTWVGAAANGDAPSASPALGSNGVIYVPSSGLAAINMDGTLRWRNPLPGPLLASPIFDALGRLLVGGTEGFIVCTDPLGTNVWTKPARGFHYGAGAASSAGVTYLADYSGFLQALTTSGNRAWEFPLEAVAASSPAIAPDGTLYIGTDDGRLRSFFGQGGLAASSWPMFQRNLGHSGRHDYVPGLPGRVATVSATDKTYNNQVEVTWTSVDGAWYYEIWRVPVSNLLHAERLAGSLSATNRFVDRTTAAGSDYFYFVRAGNTAGLGEFGAPDLGSKRIPVPGEVVDEIPFQASFANAIAVDTNGAVLIGGFHGTLHALNPDLSPRWQFETGLSAELGTPAVGTDGTIHFASDDGALTALDPAGTIRWQVTNLGLTRQSAPSVAPDGTVYVVGGRSRLHAFHPDGSRAWELGTTGLVTTATAIGVDGTIYFATGDRHFNAVSRDGKPRWRFAAGDNLRSDPAVGPDETIYFGCDDRCLYAVDLDGKLQWRLPLGGPFFSSVYASPVIGPDCTIYVGTTDGTLHAVRPDGTRRWQFAADGPIGGAATIASDGTIFLNSFYSVFALRADGRQLWRVSGVQSPFGSTLLDDGRLLNLTDSGNLVSILTAQRPAKLHWPMLHAGPRRQAAVVPWLHIPATNQTPAIHPGESTVVRGDWTLAERSLVRTELYAGTNRVAVSTNAALSLTWTNAIPGTNLLFLRAWDSAGCSYRSDSFTLRVAPLTLRLAGFDSGRLDLRFETLPGYHYQLQTTTNLLNWSPAGPPTSEAPGELRWLREPLPDEKSLRAFRISLDPQPAAE